MSQGNGYFVTGDVYLCQARLEAFHRRDGKDMLPVTKCDFSHCLSAAEGKVCPQKPDFTLDAKALKA